MFHFVAIIDRTILGPVDWNLFLKYRRDTHCIIIDNSDAFAWPKNKRKKDKEWFHVDMNDPSAISEVVSIVKKIRMKLKKEAIKKSQKFAE